MNRIEAQRWDSAVHAAHAASSLPADDFGYVEPRHVEGAASGQGLWALLGQWRERRRLRRELARVPARDLLDAGLSLEAVEHEIAQPFWRPLDRERK